MKANVQTAMPAMLQAGARVSTQSAQRKRRQLWTIREVKTTSLTALVRQVDRSYYWENALWITLGLVSLVLLVLSFLL
jgi:hypothetical protein